MTHYLNYMQASRAYVHRRILNNKNLDRQNFHSVILKKFHTLIFALFFGEISLGSNVITAINLAEVGVIDAKKS